MRHFFAAAIVATGLLGSAAVAQTEASDLREFRVGMLLRDLPVEGYTGLTCVGGHGEELQSWTDFGRCTADETGLREVSFRFNDDSEHQTKVAGQPVLLSLLLAPDGSVAGIRIKTDPFARLHLRRRGYLFGEQVMARYGEDGWACRDTKPAQGQEPVGGIFVNEHCERTIGVRHLIVDRLLYRGEQSDTRPTAFTSTTTFTVMLVKHSPS